MSEQPAQSPALVLGPGTDVVLDPASLEADAAEPGAGEAAVDGETSTPDDLGGTAGGNAGGAG